MTRPLLVFAAGKGTRMRHLTHDRPKPLVKVAGRSLLDHTLAHARPDLAAPVVVNVHTKPDMVRQAVADRGIAISDETDLLRETGGGLKHALPLLPGTPVYTMNSDAIFRGGNPLAALATKWQDGMGALLLLVPRTRAVGHPGAGDFAMDAEGRLRRAPGAIYTGVQIIDTGWLADIDEEVFSMNILWDRMMAQGALFGVTYAGSWCDVGQPESIALAEAMLEDGFDV